MQRFMLVLLCVLLPVVSLAQENKQEKDQSVRFPDIGCGPFNSKFDAGRIEATIYQLTGSERGVERWGHVARLSLPVGDELEHRVLLAVAIYWQEIGHHRNPLACHHLERRQLKYVTISEQKLTRLYEQLMFKYGLFHTGSKEPSALKDIWDEVDVE